MIVNTPLMVIELLDMLWLVSLKTKLMRFWTRFKRLLIFMEFWDRKLLIICTVWKILLDMDKLLIDYRKLEMPVLNWKLLEKKLWATLVWNRKKLIRKLRLLIKKLPKLMWKFKWKRINKLNWPLKKKKKNDKIC